MASGSSLIKQAHRCTRVDNNFPQKSACLQFGLTVVARQFLSVMVFQVIDKSTF